MTVTGRTPIALRGSFAGAMADARSRGQLVVQPRMGMARVADMGAGLEAVKAARARTVGTITVDSFTRTGDLAAARKAILSGQPLNGYPIAGHPVESTHEILAHVWDEGFPVQVRHGSARPTPIVDSMIALGMDATEGGPVSYCLPYSRLPLAETTRHWRQATERLAALADEGLTPHIESFAGCMMGQLCPPELLVALTVLEGMFFRQHGLSSVSLSLTQQTSPTQDLEALTALRALCGEYLADLDWHVVLYAYMGVFPTSATGARSLMRDAAHLAVDGRAERLIVKTTAEAHCIPTIADNVEALEHAARHTECACPGRRYDTEGDALLRASRSLIEATLELSDDIGEALVRAFARGVLDVPFCLHPDNAGRASSTVRGDGRVVWVDRGRMPLPPSEVDAVAGDDARSDRLLQALSTIRHRYDSEATTCTP